MIIKKIPYQINKLYALLYHIKIEIIKRKKYKNWEKMMYDCDLHYIHDTLSNMTSNLCDSSDYYSHT